MSNFYATRPLHAVLGGALLLFASLAQAQYVWIDEKGLKQFSDRPPPTSVPMKNILKAPGHTPTLVSTETPAADAKTAAKAASAPPTLADRNVDYKKRAKENAEKEAKAEAEAKDKQAKKENCNIARASKAELESGERFTVTDKNGERGFLSDAERAARVAKANKVLDGCD